MVGVVGQTRVVDPFHLGVFFQMLGHRQCVVADAVHAQRQGFNALQDEESIERRNRSTCVAQRHDTCTANESGWPQGFGVDHAVITDIRFVQTFEACFVLGPWEFARIDDGATNAVAVPSQVLGERLHHDVRSMLDGTPEVRTGHGVVHDQRDTMLVGNGSNGCDISDVALRVAQRLHIHRFGFGIDEGFKTGRVFVVGKSGFNAELRKGMGKQVVSAAIQSAGRHDVVPGFGNGLNGVSDGGLTRGQGQRSNAAFKRGYPLFQH